MLNHIAIIMDGNSRWAENREMPRIEGHRRGAVAVKETIKGCIKLGISHLTLYAFSWENWQRPAEEVGDLMKLLSFYLGREVKELHKNKVRINFIGNMCKLTKEIKAQISDAEQLTKNNKKLFLTIALSYGSRQEIIEAAVKAANDLRSGKTDSIDEQQFNQYLYTSNIPDPDLLIRTAGEQRLSNFLLWQSAYTELYFTKTLWPDFGLHDLQEAVEDFEKRERRYGRRRFEKKAGNI